MTQINSPYSKTVYESNRLISLLESQADASFFAREALTRHRMIHSHLELHRVRSERALEAWRTALTIRWQCEIEGQRLYNQILDQLRTAFGADSPQVRAIIHSPTSCCAGSAEDLLEAMRRMHASLLLLQPDSPIRSQTIDRLGIACCELNNALQETKRFETARRNATLERQLAYAACERACEETRQILTQQLGVSAEPEACDTIEIIELMEYAQ